VIDIHGLENEWEEFLKKCAMKRRSVVVDSTPANEEESIVHFGGMVPDGEIGKVEEEALKSNAASVPSKANRKAYIE
jgi:hypothetical protein